MGSGAGSAVITNRPTCIVYDPTNSNIFWEAGIYNSNGVYRTTDGGVTFTALGDAHHNDNVSVDFTDPQRKLLLASGHEQTNTLYKSTDAGQTWTNIGANLPANTSFSRALVINTTTFLDGCSGFTGNAGMFLSTDGGTTFTSVSASVTSNGPSAEPLVLPNGTILWEMIYNRGMLRSANNGATWVQITPYGTLTTSHPVLLPNGKIAALGVNKVLTAPNAGLAPTLAWTQMGDALPTPASGAWGGVVYEAVNGAFFVWKNDCNGSVLADGIQRYDLLITAVSTPEFPGLATHHSAAPVLAGLRGTALPAGDSYDIRGCRITRNARYTPAAEGVIIVKSASHSN
jgi:hypothetical protein